MVEELEQRLTALSALLSSEGRLLKERQKDIDNLEKEVKDVYHSLLFAFNPTENSDGRLLLTVAMLIHALFSPHISYCNSLYSKYFVIIHQLRH